MAGEEIYWELKLQMKEDERGKLMTFLKENELLHCISGTNNYNPFLQFSSTLINVSRAVSQGAFLANDIIRAIQPGAADNCSAICSDKQM